MESSSGLAPCASALETSNRTTWDYKLPNSWGDDGKVYLCIKVSKHIPGGWNLHHAQQRESFWSFGSPSYGKCLHQTEVKWITSWWSSYIQWILVTQSPYHGCLSQWYLFAMSPFSHIFELPKKHPKKRRSFLFTKHIKCSEKPVALDWNINQHLGDLGLTPHKIGNLCLSLTILPYHRFLTCRRFTNAENRLGNPGCQLRGCWSKHSYEISGNSSVINAEPHLNVEEEKKRSEKNDQS